MSSPKKSKADTAKSLQEEFGDEYTFQPAITRSASSLSRKKYLELQKKIEEKKKERKKKVLEEMNEECLFRPRINKDDRYSATIYIDPNKSRFDVLYEQAAAKKESEKRREAMNEIESDFKPKINNYNKPRSLSMQKRIQQKFKEDKVIHEKLVEKLKYDRSSRLRKREEEYRECTFQPNVYGDTSPKRLGRSKSTCLTLYKKAKIKQRQKAEEEMIRMNTKTVNTLSITKMASKAKPKVYDPVVAYTPDPSIEKTYHKEETFQPELLSSNHNKNLAGSQKRRKKILGKDKKVSVYEYLYKDGQTLQATREKIVEDANIKSRQEAKPTPIKANKIKTKFEGDFLERQKIYEEKHTQVQKQVKDKYEEEVLQEFTFKPRINEDGSQRESNSYYAGSKDDKFKRLYEQAKEKEEKLNKKREEQKDNELEGCTFRPTTNQRETGMGTADTNQKVFERLYYYEPDSSNKQRIINDSMKECTFTPTINKKKNNNDSFSPNINHSYNSTPSSARSSKKVHKIMTNIYNDDYDNENDNNYNHYRTNGSKPNSPLKATYPDSNRSSESGNSSRSISPIQQSDSEKETPTDHSNEIKRKPIQAYDSDNDSDNDEDEENNVKNNLYNQKPHKLLMMPKAPSLEEDEEEIIIPISNNNNNSDSESSSDDNKTPVSSNRSSISSNSDDEEVGNRDHMENYVINEDSNEITI